MTTQLATAQTPTDTPHSQQYLTFTLGQEMFAVGILAIREIIEYNALTTVPMMPEFVRGVINLRGRVVPVIDLSTRFGRAASVTTRRSCIVILEVNDGIHGCQEIGVLVDTVSEVLDIPDSEIEPTPGFGTHIRAEFIVGMGKVNGRFVILLDVSRVIDVEEMASLARYVEAA